MVHCFAIPSYRSSSSLFSIDLYFTELWPLDLEHFINYQFSALFFSLLADIHLIFGTLLCHTKLQIKIEFGFDRPIFHGVMALGLRKFHKLSVFCTFFLTAWGYSFDIWFIALPYQFTDQVRVLFQSIHFSLSYGPCPILALP